MPERIQLSRAKGWRMPPNTVKVDRSTRYGNPFRVAAFTDAAATVLLFRTWMTSAEREPLDTGEVQPDLAPLRGQNLACWCKPGTPCHADVLLELANATPQDRSSEEK